MKKLLLGTVALAALGASAMAADMGVRPVARPVVAYTNWTGCHIGGMVGMESGQTDGYSTNGASTIVGGSFSLQGGVPFIPGIPLSNSYNTNGCAAWNRARSLSPGTPRARRTCRIRFT